jgi:hypothetical protein
MGNDTDEVSNRATNIAMCAGIGKSRESENKQIYIEQLYKSTCQESWGLFERYHGQ